MITMERKDFLFCFSFFPLTVNDIIFLRLYAHFYKFQKIIQSHNLFLYELYLQIPKYILVCMVILERQGAELKQIKELC